MTDKIVRCGLFSALAIVVSALERFIPLQAIIPLPGIKLGLSNCIVLLVMVLLGLPYAVSVAAVKCAVVSLLFSGLTSFVYAFIGSVLAIAGMYTLLRFKNKFTLIGVSVFGAALHNTGQILAASIMLGSVYVFEYLPFLLIASAVTGSVTGIVCELIKKRVKV